MADIIRFPFHQTIEATVTRVPQNTGLMDMAQYKDFDFTKNDHLDALEKLDEAQRLFCRAYALQSEASEILKRSTDQ